MEAYEKNSLHFLFMEIFKLHHRRAHALLDAAGVYPGQPHLLMILHRRDGLSQVDLAKKLKVKPSTMTVMLKRMEKAELIERKQDSQDQRISRVFITEKGKEACEKSSYALRAIGDECFEGFTLEEEIVFRRLLLQIKKNLLDAELK